MATSEIYIVVSRSDGSVAHIAFQTRGRFPSQPKGGWERDPEGDKGFGWKREATDANIEYELARHSANWGRMGDPTLVGWRRLSLEEHEMFNKDRVYRNALKDDGGKIKHDMPKARELHKARLRHLNGDKFMSLDRQWVDASASGKKSEADAIEAKRKALRDFVNDPRIDAAQTIEELKLIVPPDDL